jgi:hypothetical protein
VLHAGVTDLKLADRNRGSAGWRGGDGDLEGMDAGGEPSGREVPTLLQMMHVHRLEVPEGTTVRMMMMRMMMMITTTMMMMTTTMMTSDRHGGVRPDVATAVSPLEVLDADPEEAIIGVRPPERTLEVRGPQTRAVRPVTRPLAVAYRKEARR